MREFEFSEFQLNLTSVNESDNEGSLLQAYSKFFLGSKSQKGGGFSNPRKAVTWCE